jgi:hypothetical protein
MHAGKGKKCVLNASDKAKKKAKKKGKKSYGY